MKIVWAHQTSLSLHILLCLYQVRQLSGHVICVLGYMSILPLFEIFYWRLQLFRLCGIFVFHFIAKTIQTRDTLSKAQKIDTLPAVFSLAWNVKSNKKCFSFSLICVLSVKLNSLSCSFSSTPFLTNTLLMNKTIDAVVLVS